MMVSPREITRFPCLLAFVLGCASSAEAGQQGPVNGNGERRTIPAARLEPDERMTVDGRLDEPVWQRAVPAGDFIQIDPNNGTPATEKTEVRVAYDRDALYLGMTVYDSEPDKWIAYQRRRDEGLPSDDKIRWTIDTFLDARSGYFFETNPLGHMADALMGTGGQNRAWDGIWTVRVHRSEIGWTVEVELPFRTVNFDPESDTWGMNFERTVQRKNETSIWMGWARNQGLQRMTNAGHVTGIRDVSQGLGIDVKPYGLADRRGIAGPFDSWTGRRSVRSRRQRGSRPLLQPHAGRPRCIHGEHRLCPNRGRSAADQPDPLLAFFPGAAGLLPRWVDILRFRKRGQSREQPARPASLWSTPSSADASDSAPWATPQKIDFGTKLTGQFGAQDVGVLHVRTGDDTDAAMIGEDFTVGRVKRRFLEQSYFGGIYTRRDARGDGLDASHTLGVDLRLATSRFLGSQNLSATGWALHATRPGISSRNSAFGVFIDYPNDLWSGRLGLREVQAAFDANRRVRRRAPGSAVMRRGSPSRPGRGATATSGASSSAAITELLTDRENQLLERSVT